MTTYRQMTRAQLEEQLRRADLPPGERPKVSAELGRRIDEELFGNPRPAEGGGRVGAPSPAATGEQARPAPAVPTVPTVPTAPTAPTARTARTAPTAPTARTAPRPAADAGGQPPPVIPPQPGGRHAAPVAPPAPVRPVVAPKGRRRGGGVGFLVLVLVGAVIGGVYALTHQEPGSGGYSYTPATTTTTTARQAAGVQPAAWRSAANAYCRKMDLRLKAAGEVDVYGDIPAVLPKRAALFREMDQHLRDMRAPDTWTDAIDKMARDWDYTAGWWSAAVDDYAKGNVSEVDGDLDKAESANQAGNVIANKLGATDCAGAGDL
jgi:hypothetical protein